MDLRGQAHTPPVPVVGIWLLVYLLSCWDSQLALSWKRGPGGWGGLVELQGCAWSIAVHFPNQVSHTYTNNDRCTQNASYCHSVSAGRKLFPDMKSSYILNRCHPTSPHPGTIDLRSILTLGVKPDSVSLCLTHTHPLCSLCEKSEVQFYYSLYVFLPL